MITIFTASKPFRGHIDIIQQNALRSWAFLHHECEIILLGNEQGTAEIASELGVRHIPEVKCNEYGTPLISDIFQIAQELAKHRLMCYVNADIILMRDFLKAVGMVARRRHHFVFVGQRWNLDITEPITFGATWEEDLRVRLIQHGQMEPPDGIDFFVFCRGMWGEIPPFVVGRPGWDNWLVFRARKLGIPVVDATKVVTVIHQNHDYSHVPDQAGAEWEGPEADYNRKLMGHWDRVFTIHDATHIVNSSGLFPALGFKYLRRRCETLPILFPAARPITRLLGTVRRLCDRGPGY